MSHFIEFSYQGLAIEALIEDYDPGDYMEPPSGGCCESLEWEVEDFNEVMEHLEVGSGMAALLLGFWTVMGRMPRRLVSQIGRKWDLEQVANDHFWHEIGGPANFD